MKYYDQNQINEKRKIYQKSLPTECWGEPERQVPELGERAEASGRLASVE
jgi:hypothetical protein